MHLEYTYRGKNNVCKLRNFCLSLYRVLGIYIQINIQV